MEEKLRELIKEVLRESLTVETYVEFDRNWDYYASEDSKKVRVTVKLSLDGEEFSSTSDYATG